MRTWNKRCDVMNIRCYCTTHSFIDGTRGEADITPINLDIGWYDSNNMDHKKFHVEILLEYGEDRTTHNGCLCGRSSPFIKFTGVFLQDRRHASESRLIIVVWHSKWGLLLHASHISMKKKRNKDDITHLQHRADFLMERFVERTTFVKKLHVVQLG